MASPIFAGLIVLMLGDSHFADKGYLISTLGDELMRQGAQVTTYAACGAAVGVWVAGGTAPCGSAERTGTGPVKVNHADGAAVPALADMADRLHPSLIIVGAGDTMAGYAQAAMPVPYLDQQVGAFTRAVKALNVPCIWIGPGWGTEGGPYFKTFARARQVNEYLAGHVAPCRYVDSQAFARPGEWPTFDGQHYLPGGYQKWAAAVDAALVRLAQTPP